MQDDSQGSRRRSRIKVKLIDGPMAGREFELNVWDERHDVVRVIADVPTLDSCNLNGDTGELPKVDVHVYKAIDNWPLRFRYLRTEPY